MRKLFMKRGEGKSTALVYASAATGCPIVVGNAQSTFVYRELAQKYHVSIPDPIPVNQLNGKRYNGILLDDAEWVINAWSAEHPNTPVVAYTMSTDDDRMMDSCGKSRMHRLADAMANHEIKVVEGKLAKYGISVRDNDGGYRDTFDILSDVANTLTKLESSFEQV